MNIPTDPAACLAALAGAGQHDRLLRLDFPRRDGPPGIVMLANAFVADEAISRDFRCTVEVMSHDANIPLTDVMGKMVTISLVRNDRTLRYFNGYVFAFRYLRTDGGFAFYEMLLRPWLAFLELRQDCATFQRLALTEITEKTFENYLSRDYRFHLSGDEPLITLAVQYNESDYNHLHRRWEAAGLHYWYEHRFDGHSLILSDNSKLAQPVDGDANIEYQSEAGAQEADGIRTWSPGRQAVSALYMAHTYEFKDARPDWADRPSLNQQGNVPALEHHEYTGAYGFNRKNGEALAQCRMDQIDSAAYEFRAESNHRSVQPGRTFGLAKHFRLERRPAIDEGKQYLVLAVRHEATNNYQTGRRVPSHYVNTFTCVHSKVPWRPPRGHNSTDTRIFGVQTAKVVGPAGEEIYTDKYGRVRVQFHWDRKGKFNECSSPWVRVMSTWAGSNFGHISLPRIGQEVVVQFLDGNCDRPLIIGSVYNAANMPPWDLPRNATQSGMVSRSTIRGKAENANVFRFEDKKGAEEIWLHAERDQRIEVEHDESHSVGQDRTKSIGRDEVVQVKRNRTETVDGDEKITVHQNRDETVDRNETIDIGEDRNESVGGDESVRIAGHRKEDVGRTKQETIALAKMLTVGAAYQVSVGAAMNTTVGMSQTSQVGLNKSTSVGRRFAIQAGEELCIEVGKASLRMRSDGTITLNGCRISVGASGLVKIDGENVNINSGGGGDSGSGSGGAEPNMSSETVQPSRHAQKVAAAQSSPDLVTGNGLIAGEEALLENRIPLDGPVSGLRAGNDPVEKIERSMDPSNVLFSKEKQQKIIAALDKERELVLGKMKELDRWNQSDKDAFFNSFGTDSEEARKFIRSRLTTIAEINAQATISNFSNAYPVGEETKADFDEIYARVNPDDPNRVVMLGPRFWLTPDEYNNTAEGTLAHEHSHLQDAKACIPNTKAPICYAIDGVIDKKTGLEAIDQQTGKGVEVYGREMSSKLPPEQSIYHADSIGFYVEGASLPRTRPKK